MMDIMIFLKIFSLGLAVISPMLNRHYDTVWMIWIFFIAIFLLSKNAATYGEQLADF